MKTRYRKILNFAMWSLIMTLTVHAWAGIHPALEGTLSQADALVVTPRTSTTVALGQAVIHMETGAIRLVRGAAEGGFLKVNAVNLTSGSRYMVLAGHNPLFTFSADSNGRFAARVTDRVQIKGMVMIRQISKSLTSQPRPSPAPPQAMQRTTTAK